MSATVHLSHTRRWGKPSLPSDTRAELELVDERRFSSGVVYLRHRTLV
jgi:hypothetical protein